MAVAIKQQRPIRGLTAVAERPDGTRVTFMPFPTPLQDETGELVGAVNMLIDVTDERQIVELRSQARRCLRLADMIGGPAQQTLALMAAEYQAKADDLEQRRESARQ